MSPIFIKNITIDGEANTGDLEYGVNGSLHSRYGRAVLKRDQTRSISSNFEHEEQEHENWEQNLTLTLALSVTSSSMIYFISIFSFSRSPY